MITKRPNQVILRRELRLFDVTNLVVGAIIGADIYVAAALGALASLFLLTQVGWQHIVIGVVLILAGMPIYLFYAPKQRVQDSFKQFSSREATMARAYEQVERFLTHPIHHLIQRIHKRKKIQSAWHVKEA